MSPTRDLLKALPEELVEGLGPRLDAAAAALDELGPTRKVREESRSLRAPDLLEAAAQTFRERNAAYSDNYLRFGAAFLSLFEGGALPEIRDRGTMDRVQIMQQILNKLMRYAAALPRGGHADSARDMIVYAAMLEELTDEAR